MIEEAYCNPEIAELLKEKGMDKECFTHYIQKNNSDGTSEAVTTCTQQMAMRWLREVFNINIEIRCKPEHAEAYIMSVESLPKCLCRGISGKTYEEAAETAIKYCLENLI